MYIYIYIYTYSVDINVYRRGVESGVRLALEIIVIFMLLVNMVVELGEFIDACMKFKALEYLTDPFNFIGM